MASERWTILPAGLVFLGVLLAGTPTRGSDTKVRLIEEIQTEQNPVAKAKKEVKLSRLELNDVHEAYSQGHMEEGTKLLQKFAGTLDDAWKTLQGSGRTASRQPEGFRELEIALREDVRTLEDLERGVEYFNRGPIEDTAHKLARTRIPGFSTALPARPREKRESPALIPGCKSGSGANTVMAHAHTDNIRAADFHFPLFHLGRGKSRFLDGSRDR